MVFPRTDENVQAVREACTVVILREQVIIFTWCSRGLSLIERNMKKWTLHKEFLHKKVNKNGVYMRIMDKRYSRTYI